MSFYMFYCILRVLFAESCDEDVVYQAEGVFVWPDTDVAIKAVLPCPRNPKSSATRWVIISLRGGKCVMYKKSIPFRGNGSSNIFF